MGGSGDVDRPMFLDDLLQAGAVHIFHHQEVQFVVLMDVIGANDIGMIQSRDGAGFPIETFERRRVLGFSGGQDLDGGATAHELVLAQIDTAHAALAKALHHFVLADREAPPAALKKLFGLEMGENAIADNFFKAAGGASRSARSEEHTSELQSHLNLVCRLLLEKKKNTNLKQSYLEIACLLLLSPKPGTSWPTGK